jgi:tRNA nucleotidyltransferase (CCA-adding enzyme)
VSRPGPAEVLKRLPDASAVLARRVIEAADAGGLAVYLVGGPVRDLLLGRSVRDVDLVVEPRDGQDAETLARAAAPEGAEIVAHDRFGTVRIDGSEASLDLATVRSETYDHDGALPSVGAGGLEDDLVRRDFSVNALALPLSRVARVRHAGIVEVGGGLEDLKRGRLRVLHPRSFHDDPTRALRAARLGPRLGFSLTRGSRTALRNALRDGAFSRVSGDRYRRELVKLFDDAAQGLDPARALRLLDEWHVLAALEPGLAFPREAGSPVRRVGRAIELPPWRSPRWRPWMTGLMVWLAPLAAALRRRALRRFAVRGAVADRIASIPRQRERILRAVERARGRGAVDALLHDLPEEELHAIHAWAEPAVRRRIVRFAGEDRVRRLPVTGADLTARGLAGPEVGRALARIRAAFLDGALSTSEEALGLAEEVVRRGKRRK